MTHVDNIVLVEVPDIGILTEGKDLPDAINIARNAIDLKCISLEDGNTIQTLVSVHSEKYREKLKQEI